MYIYIVAVLERWLSTNVDMHKLETMQTPQ